MGKKLLPLLSLGLLSVTLVACSGKKDAPAPAPAATTPAATTVTTPAPEAPAPDKVPFDYPSVKTDAKKGDTVLAPSFTMIAGSIKDPSYISYIFYNATVVEPGDTATKVKELLDETTIPNSLIIPIKAGASAKKGDIVLTWWQSGSGMQRAYVSEGGTTPTVTYLDGDDLSTEKLKADSFTVLSADWQAGSTVACKGSGGYNNLILLNVSGDKVLTSGWGGTIKVLAKSDCTLVPLKTDVKAGDTIYAAPIGSFQKATVKSVDAVKGKVKASYEFAGSTEEYDFPFGQILTKMPN